MIYFKRSPIAAHRFLISDMCTLRKGAYFESVQGGAIRVRGLAKGGPAESSGMIRIGKSSSLHPHTLTHTYTHLASQSRVILLSQPAHLITCTRGARV
jgi:hypothetical protein